MENKAAEGRYVTSKTSVWWDIDSCPVPEGYDASLVGPSIHLALEKLGYRGPIAITAIGKLKRTSEDVLRAISSTGIIVEYDADGFKSTLSDLILLDVTDPDTATVMIISSTSVLEWGSLHLRSVEKQYNMLLAYRSVSHKKPPKLVTSAEWRWKSLLKEAMCSDGKLEAKRQILQEKRSKRSKRGKSDTFTCTICYSAWQSLEAFTTHLQGLDHEVNKFGCRANPDYLDSQSQEMLELELEDLKRFLEEDAASKRLTKVTTKRVNRITHLLAMKNKWEELKAKLQESGRSASGFDREQRKRFKRYMKKLANEKASRDKKKRKMEKLKKKLRQWDQLASQGQHEQGKELETSLNSEQGGVEKETDELASQGQPHEQEKQLEASLNGEEGEESRELDKAKDGKVKEGKF